MCNAGIVLRRLECRSYKIGIASCDALAGVRLRAVLAPTHGSNPRWKFCSERGDKFRRDLLKAAWLGMQFIGPLWGRKRALRIYNDRNVFGIGGEVVQADFEFHQRLANDGRPMRDIPAAKIQRG